jgi:predicted transcriptional regulator
MNDQIQTLAAEGKSTREIAAALGISQSKVSRALRKAPGDGHVQIASTISETATVPVPDLSVAEAKALDAVAWLCLSENEGHAWTAAVAAAEDLTDSEADRALRSLCRRGLIEYTGRQCGERFYIMAAAA